MADQPGYVIAPLTLEEVRGLTFKELQGQLGAVGDVLNVANHNAKTLTVELLGRHSTLLSMVPQKAPETVPDPPVETQPDPPEPEQPGETVPAVPKDQPHKYAHEEFLGMASKLYARSCEVNAGMTAQEIVQRVNAAGCNMPGSIIRLVGGGYFPALQLGHRYGIQGPGGAPLAHVAIVGTGKDTVVRGIKLEGAAGGGNTGCGEGVGLAQLVAQPMHENDSCAVQVMPGGQDVGTHLVLEDIILRGTPNSKKWNGCGYKWALSGHEFRLTARNIKAEGGQEHPWYIHSQQGGVLIDGWEVIPVPLFPAGALEGSILAGFGRTSGQFVARPNESCRAWGDIIVRGLKARRCGWEGLQGFIDRNGIKRADLPDHGQGGGSAFTVAGNPAGRIVLEDYEGLDNYCSELAVYPDNSAGDGFLQVPPTITNPHGIRTWLLDVDTLEEFNPLDNARPAYGYMAPDLVIKNWRATWTQKPSRQAMMIEAVRRVSMKGARLNGAAIVSMADPQVRTGYYPWAAPIGQSVVQL